MSEKREDVVEVGDGASSYTFAPTTPLAVRP